jgi:hypothetical protein
MVSSENSKFSFLIWIQKSETGRASNLNLGDVSQGKFYQGFLGFYRKVTCLLTDCNCIHAEIELGLKSDS